MVDVETRTTRAEGVTFVTATVTNGLSTPQLVCLESEIDGPTWPPRRGAYTSPEWDGETCEISVPPGGRRGVGFASPGRPVDGRDPVVVTECRRVDDEPGTDPTSVLAELDDWGPPSDVLR